MWVRKRIEIAPRHLLRGLWQCITPKNWGSENRQKTIDQITRQWDPTTALVCLSVRSGFDLLLQSSDWEEQSEIIMSGLTIPDMPRIVRANGMVPVGVDIELNSMAPNIAEIESKITPRTKAIVVAHLFGGLCDIEPVIELARQHDLIVVEDCAQAYVGQSYQGHPQADVSMFSFGPIKTNTALGGAVFQVRRGELLEQLRFAHQAWQIQSRFTFAKRLMKYGFVKLMSTRVVCGFFYRLMRFFGSDHDGVASTMARGFAGAGFFKKIRRQPSQPLLDLLELKLRKFDPRTTQKRCEFGELFRKQISSDVHVLGSQMIRQTYWVLPILVSNPQPLVKQLWDLQFDASNSCSLEAVFDDDAGSVARFILDHIVFLPLSVEMPVSEVCRLARVINQLDPETPALPQSGAMEFRVGSREAPAILPATEFAKSAMVGEAS